MAEAEAKAKAVAVAVAAKPRLAFVRILWRLMGRFVFFSIGLNTLAFDTEGEANFVHELVNGLAKFQ